MLAALEAIDAPRRKLGGPTTQFGLESMFGLLASGSRSQLKSPRERDGSYEFTHENVVVLTYRNSQYEIPDSLRPSFRRLLSYELPIHPTMRMHLATQAQLPQEMSIRYMSDGGVREIKLRLKSVGRETLSRFSHPPADHQLIRSYEPEVRELLDTLDKRPAPTLKQAQQAADSFVNASIREERFLDGVLACAELFYQTGDGAYSGQLMRRLEQVADDDTRTKQFFDVMDGESQAIRKFRESHDFVGYKKLYVMDYMLADKLLSEGAGDEAHRLLTKALAGNPWLIGAYVDLARMHIAEFDSLSAWHLIRAAQSISPTHQDLRPFIAVEENLANDFPDFF